MMLQYLNKFPNRQFENNMDNGFFHHFLESTYALFGTKGFESIDNIFPESSSDQERGILNEEIKNENLLDFPEIDTTRKHVVNWDRAFIYLIPQMPNYKKRNEIIEKMKLEEPKMIENFRMLKKFKEEVERQNPGLNEMQLQQRAMMKMQ